MKHGFVLISKDEVFGEITFGSYKTLREAEKSYRHVLSSPNVEDFAKKHLRLVELVEKEIVVNV